MSPTKTRLPRRRHLWSAALLAASFASAGIVGASQTSSFEESIHLQAVTPFLALSNARLEGVADTVGSVSPALQARLDAFSSEADQALRTPGAEQLVTLVQLERAYLTGVEDATTYVYGEEELARMLDGVTSLVPQITAEASGVRENLIGAGVSGIQAEQLATLSATGGARSAFNDQTLWMNALSGLAAETPSQMDSDGLEESNLALIEGISLSAMMRVTQAANHALLKDHNASKDQDWTMIQAEVFQASQESAHEP